MNDAGCTEVLERVTADVLEQCAFLLTVKAQRLAAWCAKDPLHAVIEFSGPRAGWLRLSAPRGLLRELCADMVGTSTEEADAEANANAAATLRELANIIAGALLAALFGKEPAFELGIPGVRSELPATPAFAERFAVTLVTEAAQPLEAELVLVARCAA